MSTKYPAQIDDNITLPPSTDNSTNAKSMVPNDLRGAIVAVEAELGVRPSSMYGTVAARLDSIDNSIEGVIEREVTFAGDLGGTNISQKVVGLQGFPISTTAPTDGYVLSWSQSLSKWIPKKAASGGGGGGAATDIQTNSDVVNISGSDAPTAGQVLVANNSSSATWQTIATGSDRVTALDVNHIHAWELTDASGSSFVDTGSSSNLVDMTIADTANIQLSSVGLLGNCPFWGLTAIGHAASASASALVSSFTDLPNNNFTIEAWIFPSTNSIAPDSCIFSCDFQASVNFQIYLDRSNDNYSVLYNTNNFATLSSQVTTFFVGSLLEQWAYLAVTYDSSNVRIFLNGDLVAISNNTSGFVQWANTNGIAPTITLGSQAGSTNSLTGKMSRVRMSNIVRSQSYMKAVYEKALGAGIGQQGPAGITGPQGMQGATGAGVRGATGPQGIQGVTGPSGPTGARGQTGPAGSNGSNGATGSIGPAGPTGTTGPAGSGGLVWVTGLDIDFTSLTTQSLGTDGTYTIGGIAGWQKQNSTNENSAMTITNGTGLQIYPKATAMDGSTRTSPLLWLPLSSIAVMDWSTQLRIWFRISGYTLTFANPGDECFIGLDSNNSDWTPGLFKWIPLSGSSTRFYMLSGANNALITSGQFDVSGTIASNPPNVMRFDLPGIAAFQTGSGIGYWDKTSSAWPATTSSSLKPIVGQAPGNNYSHIEKANNSGLGVGAGMGILIGAGAGGGGDAFVPTITNIRVDYR